MGGENPVGRPCIPFTGLKELSTVVTVVTVIQRL